MKKLKLFFTWFIYILLIGCASNKMNKVPFTEEDYILAYKKEVLYGCINQKTENNFYKLMDSYKDLGLYTEVSLLYHEVADNALQLGENFSKTIKPVNYPDAENKLPIFRDCVDYAFGKEVDSIARATYKRTR